MNKSDSERIAAMLEKNNYKKASSKKAADIVVLVACSVRQSAVDRLYSQINQLKKEKKPPKIFLTGCISLQDQEKLRKKVDIIFNIKNLKKIFEKPTKKHLSSPLEYLKIKPIYSSPFSAFVPISTGCNNFCSYCIVPYVRGPEICRPVKDILEEIRGLIKKNYKEITLLGQNVNSYLSTNYKPTFPLKLSAGKDKSKYIDFPKLLQMIENIPGNFWITFISNHPKDLSLKLIETVAKSKKICPYFHLPIQSGDNEILKLMNRKYTTQSYENLVSLIRQKIKDVSISTDIIVGLPNETKKQFQNTANLMKKINFDMAYIARYSPRPGTALAKLKDNISDQEKMRRRKILENILKKTALSNNLKYIGRTMDALIVEQTPTALLGHLKNQKHILVPYKKDKSSFVGQFIKTKITKATSWGLEGIF